MRYRPLEIYVNDICEAIGDDNYKKFTKVLKSCARFLERFNCFHETPYYRSIGIPVSNNYTATLPDDCMKPIKVGLCINGKIRGFYYNQDLCEPATVTPSCSCNEAATTSPCSFCTFPNYYNDGANPSSCGENFSASPYQTAAGWFKFDLTKNRIIFDPNSNIQPNDEVVLMYRSANITVNGKIVVPTEFYEAMKFHVKSELDSANAREELTYKAKSESEELGIVRLYGRMTPEELEAAIGGYKKSAPQR
jgi:hypothetical protein